MATSVRGESWLFFYFLGPPSPAFILIELNFVSVWKKVKVRFILCFILLWPLLSPSPSYSSYSPLGSFTHLLFPSIFNPPPTFETPTQSCHLFLIRSTPLYADYNIDSKFWLQFFLSERASRGAVGGWCIAASRPVLRRWGVNQLGKTPENN
jgi:hypothetical protein